MLGCTNPCASNYDPDAIQDDGSCEERTISYIGVDGNNEGAGSEEDPYLSLSKALDCSTNGDSILYLPGTHYDQEYNFESWNIDSLAFGSLYLTTGDSTYVDSTILDAQDNYRFFYIENKHATLHRSQH